MPIPVGTQAIDSLWRFDVRFDVTRSCDTARMPFGQTAGPPATPRQVKELLELLQVAGHTDFRDARGPMRFNQRQAAGRFTRDEADGFIEQLQATADGEADTPVEAPVVTRAPHPSTAERALRRFSDQALAAELQRRGWIVVEP
jgi:hypothetical protein